MLDKFRIYKLTIRKTTKDELKQHKESKYISLVGGKLVMTIQSIILNINNKNIRFSIENDGFALCEKIFLDNSFLKRNDKLTNTEILKLTHAYVNDKWTAVTVVQVSKFLK